MKTLIASAVSLLLGLMLGWYLELRRAEHEKTEIVQQMVQGTESSDRERAARAVRAIEALFVVFGYWQERRAVNKIARPATQNCAP